MSNIDNITCSAEKSTISLNDESGPFPSHTE